MEEKINEYYEFLVKILLPAFVGVSIKVAIQIKNEGFNYTRIIISFIAGVGCAYFFFPLIENYTQKNYVPLIIGLIAISGERISEWAVYKLKIDVFISVFLEFLIDKFNPKK
tara:strand:+ start:133 stop:468 length:336 start_codon:yes stop_codon:yes gene_type:complete